MKPRAVERILNETVAHAADAARFCLADTDLAFLTDPLPWIQRFPFVVTADMSGGLNSGFFCADVRSTIARKVILAYIEQCARTPNGWCGPAAVPLPAAFRTPSLCPESSVLPPATSGAAHNDAFALMKPHALEKGRAKLLPRLLQPFHCCVCATSTSARVLLV